MRGLASQVLVMGYAGCAAFPENGRNTVSTLEQSWTVSTGGALPSLPCCGMQRRR